MDPPEILLYNLIAEMLACWLTCLHTGWLASWSAYLLTGVHLIPWFTWLLGSLGHFVYLVTWFTWSLGSPGSLESSDSLDTHTYTLTQLLFFANPCNMQHVLVSSFTHTASSFPVIRFEYNARSNVCVCVAHQLCMSIFHSCYYMDQNPLFRILTAVNMRNNHEDDFSGLGVNRKVVDNGLYYLNMQFQPNRMLQTQENGKKPSKMA